MRALQIAATGMSAQQTRVEVISNNTVTWSWFIGNSSEVEPGQYRLRVTYTMTRPGWPAKRIFVLSNQFNVRA